MTGREEVGDAQPERGGDPLDVALVTAEHRATIGTDRDVGGVRFSSCPGQPAPKVVQLPRGRQPCASSASQERAAAR